MVLRAEIQAVLDETLRYVEAADAEGSFGCMVPGLFRIRKALDYSEWRRLTREFQGHAVLEALSEDPYTRRAQERPRGYAGDPELLDYVFGERAPDPLTTTLRGQKISQVSVNTPLAQGVNGRKLLFGELLSQTRPGSKIVCFASGHMRELACLTQGQLAQLGRILAVDQDEESLRFVSSYGIPQLETLKISTMEMFSPPSGALEGADLIYVPGLFDYLNAVTGRRVIRRLYELLAPGGRLVVANLAMGQVEVGYMELALNWWMEYRDEAGLRGLGEAALAGQDADVRTYTDSPGRIVFLSACKPERSR